MNDTTLITLLSGLIMGIAGSALYEIITHLVQHPVAFSIKENAILFFI